MLKHLMPAKWLTVVGVIFVFHVIIGWFVAHRHAELFYHPDGDSVEYAELAFSLAQTGTMTIKEPRYYEAPRATAIPEAYRAPLLPALGAVGIWLLSPFGGSPLTALVGERQRLRVNHAVHAGAGETFGRDDFGVNFLQETAAGTDFQDVSRLGRRQRRPQAVIPFAIQSA
ncbi:hypothetical protein FACS1894139_19120 [Planctomycetales bacterium]|nr:hypothetical protein FACS1894139_19120 [Planctomycetales bacterium]